MTEEIYVRCVETPARVKGFTMPGPDGEYNIYISERLDQAARLRVFKHELRHVKNGDYEREDTRSIEAEAHECDT